MSHESNISDELLNAFLDHQLDASERIRVVNALEHDESLARRVCGLRRIKELTQHAYDTPPAAPARLLATETSSHGHLYRAAAGIALVAMGALLGWTGHRSVDVSQPMLALSEPAGASVKVAQGVAAAQQKRVILHLSSGDPARVKASLDLANDLLRVTPAGGEQIKVEIIANADGLNLLRRDVSPYVRDMREMLKQYSNLTFLACRRAIKRLEEKGVEVEIVPEAEFAPSAIDHIIERLQAGWVYIKA